MQLPHAPVWWCVWLDRRPAEICSKIDNALACSPTHIAMSQRSAQGGRKVATLSTLEDLTWVTNSRLPNPNQRVQRSPPTRGTPPGFAERTPPMPHFLSPRSTPRLAHPPHMTTLRCDPSRLLSKIRTALVFKLSSSTRYFFAFGLRNMSGEEFPILTTHSPNRWTFQSLSCPS